ncbi:RagB/SusD family nutrient uptake outer membrane protein [Olivibacter sp. CPCC 100613]|uniref:RagB/SusD family nutrient uptake outer membrane protein n=1 Tax=Olivibacter sp. CPCC 100613 TaxID=3079931 RepID=UPI002FF67D0E
MKQKLFRYYLIAIITSFTGCSNFVEVELPPNQIGKINAFNNEATATSVISGIYSNLSNISHTLNADMHIAVALNADELSYSQSSQTYLEFLNSNIQTNNTLVGSFWSTTYSSIYNANMAIEGLLSSSNLSESVRNQLLGEAKFIRAFCYFYLVNLFGDLPLILETDYQNNQRLGRTEIASIYEQIESDLTEAETLLTEGYPVSDKVRPNRLAATALLSRVYLYREKWQLAEAKASDVINSGLYSLPDLSAVFLKASEETIWQLMPVFPGYNTNIGRILIPTSSGRIPNYFLIEDFLQSFSNGDKRQHEWISSLTIADKIYHSPHKYKVQIGTELSEYLVVFRLAEQYLIRAEALARQNDISRALQDLNIIRKRAGLEEVVINSTDEMIDEVRTQRRHELFMEWGHRWFDLKRLSLASSVLQSIKGANWQSTDIYWPIPLQELDSNPFLIQNEGY